MRMMNTQEMRGRRMVSSKHDVRTWTPSVVYGPCGISARRRVESADESRNRHPPDYGIRSCRERLVVGFAADLRKKRLYSLLGEWLDDIKMIPGGPISRLDDPMSGITTRWMRRKCTSPNTSADQ